MAGQILGVSLPGIWTDGWADCDIFFMPDWERPCPRSWIFFCPDYGATKVSLLDFLLATLGEAVPGNMDPRRQDSLRTVPGTVARR